jgi:hypothetical protein
MSNRTGMHILRAYKVINACLAVLGLQLKLHQQDNKASTILKQYMSSEGIDYQRFPCGVHHCNTFNLAMHTFKNHFNARLCSSGSNFSLVPQAELTLSILQSSRLNPMISALAQLALRFQ